MLLINPTTSFEQHRTFPRAWTHCIHERLSSLVRGFFSYGRGVGKAIGITSLMCISAAATSACLQEPSTDQIKAGMAGLICLATAAVVMAGFDDHLQGAEEPKNLEEKPFGESDLQHEEVEENTQDKTIAQPLTV